MDRQVVEKVKEFLLTQEFISDETISQLRKGFEGIHFTYCSDDDIYNAVPYLTEKNFSLYLVDGNNHCLNLTVDLDHSTGLVVAEIEA